MQLKAPPRIPELVFAAVLIWLFATGQGWSVLLADGDSGWHIRNGERIIDTRSIPHRDVFSFGSDGHPWFAWEWLSDVLFAALYRKGGLKAVAVFCGIVIAAGVSVLFRHIVWRSVGVCIALPLTLVDVGASSIHYLARPHVIGLLFFVISAWMIDRDRASPKRLTWGLPLLFLVWANCHGSFLAGLAMLFLWFIEAAIIRRSSLSRPSTLFAASAFVTVCNPYGWGLHAHAFTYLRSSWIQTEIDEFQSPRFRSESMFQYEALLIAGLAALPWLLRRKEIYPAGVILLWTHESLVSVRHVPIFCLAAGPFIASSLQRLWNEGLRTCRPGSLLPVFQSINLTWQRWCVGYTLWPIVLCLILGGTAAGPVNQLAFPSNKFPAKLVERNLSSLTVRDRHARRIFSSDQWSDYLIFRLYPHVQVYFDGRSDFFGPWRGRQYQQLMAGAPDSAAMLDREAVDLALLPVDWALSGILKVDPHWRIADADDQAVLFVRCPPKFAYDPNQNLPNRR
jgi:hypothetical protein